MIDFFEMKHANKFEEKILIKPFLEHLDEIIMMFYIQEDNVSVN